MKFKAIRKSKDGREVVEHSFWEWFKLRKTCRFRKHRLRNLN